MSNYRDVNLRYVKCPAFRGSIINCGEHWLDLSWDRLIFTLDDETSVVASIGSCGKEILRATYKHEAQAEFAIQYLEAARHLLNCTEEPDPDLNMDDLSDYAYVGLKEIREFAWNAGTSEIVALEVGDSYTVAESFSSKAFQRDSHPDNLQVILDHVNDILHRYQKRLQQWGNSGWWNALELHEIAPRHFRPSGRLSWRSRQVLDDTDPMAAGKASAEETITTALTTSNTTTPSEETSMFNLDKNSMFNAFTKSQFAKIDTLMWDLQSGSIGIKTPTGIATLESTTEEKSITYGVSVNPLEFMTMSVPAFAIATPVESINIGDMVVSANDTPIGWVTKKNPKSFDVLKVNGETSRWNPPTVKLLGLNSGPKIVRSLFNTAGGAAGIQASLMPLMMFMGDDSGKGKDKDMMEMMVMMTIFQQMGSGGEAGANPMANMFGGGNNPMGGMMGLMFMKQMMDKK